jgi:hypothetical protein
MSWCDYSSVFLTPAILVFAGAALLLFFWESAMTYRENVRVPQSEWPWWIRFSPQNAVFRPDLLNSKGRQARRLSLIFTAVVAVSGYVLSKWLQCP